MLRTLVPIAMLVFALSMIIRGASADILYPCGCAEYYVKTCAPCPQQEACPDGACTRTTTWQNAYCKSQTAAGTCTLLTNQPGYSNKLESWKCTTGDNNTCLCPTGTEPTVTLTPVNVSVLINPTTNCDALQCNQNRNCTPS
jgi:hypothetical protein